MTRLTMPPEWQAKAERHAEFHATADMEPNEHRDYLARVKAMRAANNKRLDDMPRFANIRDPEPDDARWVSPVFWLIMAIGVAGLWLAI